MMKIKKTLSMALVFGIGAVLAMGAEYRPLPEQTKAAIGASHVLILKASDLSNTNANTAQSLTNLVSIPAKHGVECVAAVLKTAFYAGTTNITSTTVKVGDAGDDDRYLNAMEVQKNATEEFFKWGNRTFNSASTTIAAVTNVKVATEIDCLDSVTPTKASAVTAVGAIQTDDVVTGYGSPTSDTFVKSVGAIQTDDVVTEYGSPETADCVTEYGSPTSVDMVTNIVWEYSGTLYDSTGAALTNAAGDAVSILTNGILQTASGLTGLGSASIAKAITNLGLATTIPVATNLAPATTDTALTGLGTATTIPAVTNLAEARTGEFVDDITSNVVQAAKTLEVETANALASYTVTQGQYVYTTATPLKVTVTPTGISGLSTLTAGEIYIYLRDIDQPTFGK